MAVIMGTSTSSIGASEEAYTRLEYDAEGARFPDDLQRARHPHPHSLGQRCTTRHGPVRSLRYRSDRTAPLAPKYSAVKQHALVASGVSERRWPGGVDALCGSVLPVERTPHQCSPEPCRPFDVHRAGLSLGEAGGLHYRKDST